MPADEVTPEEYDKFPDGVKVEYLTNEMGKSAKLLVEGYHIMSQLSDRYDDLSEGVKELLDFVKKKFPDDFKEGGKGFTCEHHKRLAAHLKRWDIK